MATNYTQERLEEVTATIAISTTTSDAIDCLGKVLVGLIMPAAFTGTTLTIQVSMDKTTFQPFYNTSGSAVSITVGVDRHIGIVPADFAGARWFKLVGSSQAAEREITVILRGM